MAKYVTYRGATIDMDGLYRENEKVTAVGNMSVNARGDEIKNGAVTKTADEIARERNRVKSVIVNSGLKGPLPEDVESPVIKTPAKATSRKPVEKELPNGDIMVDGSKDF